MIIVGAILGYFSIVSVLVIPIIFGIIFIYSYILATLRTLFGSSSKDGNDTMSKSDVRGSKIINEFRITARIIVSGFILSGIFIVLYGIYTIVFDWKKTSKENMVSPLAIGIALFRTGFIIANFGLARYIHKRVAVIMEKNSAIFANNHGNSAEQFTSELSSKEQRVVTPSSRIYQESHN